MKAVEAGSGAVATTPSGMPAWTDAELSARGEKAPGDEDTCVPRVRCPIAKKIANIATAHTMKAKVCRKSIGAGLRRARARTCSIRMLFMMRDTL